MFFLRKIGNAVSGGQYLADDDPVLAGALDVEPDRSQGSQLVGAELGLGHAQLVEAADGDVAAGGGGAVGALRRRKDLDQRVVEQVGRVFQVAAADAVALQALRLLEVELDGVAGLRHQAPEETLAPVGALDRVGLVGLDGRRDRRCRIAVRREQRHFAELFVLQVLDFTPEGGCRADVLEQGRLVVDPLFGFDGRALFLLGRHTQKAQHWLADTREKKKEKETRH